jgi:hypothetical protein
MADSGIDFLPKYLAELTRQGLSASTEYVKKTIVEAWLKRQYGVTIPVQDAESLRKISETDFYKLFKRYLGGHWSLELIKVGLYLQQLNEAGDTQRVRQLIDEAYQKRGLSGSRIIQLASTGVLELVMNYLIDLKVRKRVDTLVLHKEFDKILEEWQSISIPIQHDSKEVVIQSEIQKIMDRKNPIFFVYACGSAARNAQLILAGLNNTKFWQGKYLMYSHVKNVRRQDGAIIEYCMWEFEILESIPPTVFSQ